MENQEGTDGKVYSFHTAAGRKKRPRPEQPDLPFFVSIVSI
jgi:hypothetical protein